MKPDEGISRRKVLQSAGVAGGLSLGFSAFADGAQAQDQNVALISAEARDAIVVTRRGGRPEDRVLPEQAQQAQEAREELAAAAQEATGRPVDVAEATVYSARPEGRGREQAPQAQNAAVIKAQEPPADLPEEAADIAPEIPDIAAETNETLNQVLQSEGEQAVQEEAVVTSSEPSPYETPIKSEEVRERVAEVAGDIARGRVESQSTVATTYELSEPQPLEQDCEEVDEPGLCEELEATETVTTEGNQSSIAPRFGHVHRANTDSTLVCWYACSSWCYWSICDWYCNNYCSGGSCDWWEIWC